MFGGRRNHTGVRAEPASNTISSATRGGGHFRVRYQRRNRSPPLRAFDDVRRALETDAHAFAVFSMNSPEIAFDSDSSCASCGVLVEMPAPDRLCAPCRLLSTASDIARTTLLDETGDVADDAITLCSRCAAPLSRDALHGVCLKCLFTIPDGDSAAWTAVVPKIPGYSFGRQLGRGGMGEVWLAEQTATKQLVAVKLCRTDRIAFGPGSPALRRFEREIELAARLSHPHIARVFGGGEFEELPYCVIEYIEGENLSGYVRTHQLDRRAVVALMAKIAEAVQHAHQNGIIHRDLKPSNILVTVKGEPKVLDFGLAKALEAGDSAALDLSLSGEILGTPRYMAPEQVRGDAVDTRTDVYALGVILYELLTGEHPHDITGSRDALLHRIATAEPRRPRTVCRDLGSELEMLLLKALSRSPADRYRTAGEFADDLTHWLRDEPLSAGRATPLYFARKWLTRHRAPALTAIGIVTAGIAATALYIGNIRRSEAETSKQKKIAEDRLSDIKRADVRQHEQLREASWFSASVALNLRDLSGHQQSALAHLAKALDYYPENQHAAAQARNQLLQNSSNAGAWQVGTSLRHAAAVRSAAFSPDGRWVVTTSHTARVWEAATGNPVGTPLRHDDDINSAAFSPDGRWVVTASYDKTARVWEAATGNPVGTPLRHDARGLSAAFSPDGRWVVTASNDKTARVWEAATGNPVGTPLRHDSEVRSAGFSPDGRWVVTTSDDQTARVWEAATGNPVGTPLRHDSEVRSAAFSPDGRWVVTASDDKTARVWEAATGNPVGTPLHHDAAVRSAAFSPDGRWVVTASEEKTVRVWEAVTGDPVGTPLRHDSRVLSAAFSPDGCWVVTSSYDKTARVWEAATGNPVGTPLRHDSEAWSAAFSPDGRWVLTASRDKTAQVWEAATGNPVGTPLRHAAAGLTAAFSPDGRSVMTASDWKTARVWEAATGNPVGTPLRHDSGVTRAAFSPDGRWVVTATADNTARVWEAATGNPVGTPMRHDSSVRSAAFSPNGRWLVTASDDGTARVWEAATGNLVGTPLRHDSRVFSAAFSPDGRWVLTTNGDNTAQFWEAATGNPVGTPMRHDSSVSSAAFSPDGRSVVTASSDKTARVWEAATGNPVGTPLRHDARVESAAFSPDGRRVVTLTDVAARFWDVTSGKPLGQPLGDGRRIHAAFSRDGRWLLTTSGGSTARIWETALDLATPPQWLPRFLTTLSGREISTDGAEGILSAEKRRLARDELLSTLDDGSEWQRIMRWYFSDPRAAQLLRIPLPR